MIVIEHLLTKEKFMFPSSNTNMETPTGFIQVQDVPRGFRLSPDQTPVPIHYYQTQQPESPIVRWEAESKDPLDKRNSRNY